MNASVNPSVTSPLGIGALVNEWYRALGTTRISIFPPGSIPTALDQIKLQKIWEEIIKKDHWLPKNFSAKESIDHVIVQARDAHNEIQKYIVGKGITIESVINLLSQELGKIYEDLKDEVDNLSPNGHHRNSGKARDRAQFVSQIMEKVGTVYIRVLTGVGVPRDVAETQFSDFSLLISRVILVAGHIIDKHPFLFNIIILVVSTRLSGLSGLPLLMRLILPLLGFGPLGPVKGSATAWAQKTLWGSSVSPGSWFAILQQLGMAPPRGLLGRLFGTAGLVSARL